MNPRGRLAQVVAGVGVALVLVPAKALVDQLVGGDIGLMPAIVVVIAVAWRAGFVPGLAATATSAIAEAIVFIPSARQFTLVAQTAQGRLALFVIIGCAASWAIEQRRAADRRSAALHADSVAERDRADLLARRLGALQAVGAELAQAGTTSEIVDVLVRHGETGVEADATFVFLLAEGGRQISIIGARGFMQDRLEASRSIPLSLSLPATDATRTGKSVFIEDPQEVATRYAHSFRELGIETVPVAVAVAPMWLNGRVVGGLGFTWSRPGELAPDRRAFVEALAGVGAGALQRARLVDQEREAFRRLEATQARLDLLSEAGRVFGLSLDFESTLRRVGGLAVPMLGDLCVVDVLEGPAGRRMVAAGSEELAAAAAELERHVARPGDRCPVGRAIAAGAGASHRVDPVGEFPDHDDHEAAALRAVGARAMLVVPLQAMDRTIGAISFMRRADRPYDADETATAAQLADRAVHALENARLHREVRGLAERESRRAGELEAVLGAVADGFLVVDEAGTVISSNAASARLLGGPVPTLAALLERLVGVGDASAAELGLHPQEYRLRERPSAWVEIAAYPVRRSSGGQPSTVVVCRDVTAFRQGQALREAFMGLLSHELRTPVTTIYGGAAVLTRRTGQLDSATADEVLADIAGEADRLYRLVEDLLVLARFDEGFEVGSDPVLLQRVVPAVVEQENERWPGVTFDVEVTGDLAAVSGDETSITQVLRNLLSNASKYSGSNARIEVVVEATADGAAVRVLDQGPGIDPLESDHLFDAFYRSPSTVTLAGGAGIGLYVSRRLVDAMGGRIWARRRTVRGSEFGFALPTYAPDDVDAREFVAPGRGALP